MPSFTELPVRNGVGPYHLNRFRIYIHPKPGERMPTGVNLMDRLTEFMDAETASVRPDPHRWQNFSTLRFLGRARVRPFISAMLPSALLALPGVAGSNVIGKLRELEIPPLHTDSVGLPVPFAPHAFTAQTLKREFESREDAEIRRTVRTQVQDKLAYLLNPLVRLVANEVIDAVVDHVIDVNRHHFLAGRRSFRIGMIRDFRIRDGVPAGFGGDDWVFETAAVERFSLPEFLLMTDIVLGGNARMLRPVWTQMCKKLAKRLGTQADPEVFSNQQEFRNLGEMQSDSLYTAIISRHPDLLPPNMR